MKITKMALLALSGMPIATAQQDSREIRALADRIREEVRAKVAASTEGLTSWPSSSSSSRTREDEAYRRASRLVDDRKYEEALEQYQRVVDLKSARVEGALFWKAYVLGKLGRRDDATQSLAELKKSYPQSRWLNDARALEMELQQSGGRAASPEAENDEELKLLAINGLLASDPDRAVPLLEKQLTSPKNSPKLKERALFVLAQSRNLKAREIVASFAKGGSNPDLQSLSIQYLGTFGGKESRDTLAEIYKAVSEPQLKRAVLRGLMMARDQEYLVQIAKSEQNAELQREAIRYAASSGADILSLWNASAPKEIKEAVLEGLMARHQIEKLAEIARSDSDVRIRREAIQMLSASSRKEKTAPLLINLYASEQDKQVRTSILRAFRNQNNAKALVEVAKKEADPALKREAVQMLSNMKSPEATEFLVELLNK